jgi:hypothetical protein
MHNRQLARRIHSVMRFNDSGRMLAHSLATPMAIYDDPAGGGGTPPVGGTPPADKTYTQAEVDAQVAGLKNKNAELLGKVKTATERVKDLPDDATPEEIKEAIENQRRSKQEQLEAKGKFDELVRQMGEKHTTEKTKLESQITTLNTRIQTREKKLAISAALTAKDGNTTLLMPHLLEQTAVEEDGDEYVVFAVDRKGQPIVGADGKKKTVEQLVAELSEDPKYLDAFKAPAVGGSGARGSSAGTAGGNGDVVLTNAQAKDVQTYRQARERAAKNNGSVVIRG